MLLNNKKFLFFLIIIIVFLVVFTSIAHAQQVCDIGNIQKVLRKVLYSFFINPKSSPLSTGELKDLLVFYLSIKEKVGQVDCSVTGSISNSSIFNIMDSGKNATDTIPTCSDGTRYGECSTFKPKYCYAGSLLHRCDYCSCPNPSQCTTSGKCDNTTIVNATCSTNLDCKTGEICLNGGCQIEKVNATNETVLPNIITIKGRWIDYFTNNPISNAIVLTWDNETTRRDVYTDANGEFAITADTTQITTTNPKGFGSWPSCYDALGFAVFRDYYDSNKLNVNVNIFDLIGRDRFFPITSSLADIGNTPFWPAVIIYIYSDIPVKFGIEYDGGKIGSGNIFYKTLHVLSNSFYLNTDVRVKLTDESGNVYYSPYLNLPLSHGCTPVKLNFTNKQANWIGFTQIRNATCLTNLDCGTSEYGRFNYCKDGKLLRNYYNITCTNLACSNQTVVNLIDDCKLKGQNCEWNQTVFNYVCQGAIVNATKQNLSAVVWPANIKPAFSYAAYSADWGKVGQQVSFDYNNISALKSLRLYEKKPKDASFNLVSEFTNLALVGCNKYVLSTVPSGNWKLTGDCSSLYAGKTWHAQRIIPPYTNMDLQPASFYDIGEYKYYVTAVDASNNYLSSAIGSMHFLNPLTIISPKSSQSPISKLNFTWTLTSGWPIGAKPYNIQVAKVNSTVEWSKSGLSSSPVMYDGSALDPSKKYTAHIYGYWANANQSISYTAIEVSTTTFWVSNATSQTSGFPLQCSSCAQRTTGSGFRCNFNGEFNSIGSAWCTCLNSPSTECLICGNNICEPNEIDTCSYDCPLPGETRITGNLSKIPGTRIAFDSDKIIWRDDRNGNPDIYMYDLSTGKETRITSDVAYQDYPAIYGNKIVWADWRNGNPDIYMYDLSTGKETRITTNSALQTYPAIYGNKIVWVDGRNANVTMPGNTDIYMYDLSTNKETGITTGPAYQEMPDIYENKIVWEDSRTGFGTRNIFMYDLSTGKETQLTSFTIFANRPKIYNNYIIFYTYDSSGKSIMRMYDIGSGQEKALTGAGSYFEPNIHGNFMVWRGSSDLFTYEITTGRQTQITAGNEAELEPDVYNNKIAFIRQSIGKDIYVKTIY